VDVWTRSALMCTRVPARWMEPSSTASTPNSRPISGIPPADTAPSTRRRQGLLRRLTAALADKSLTETLRWYTNFDLLVIDEFGLDQIEREECPKAAHLLYKVIVSRHHKRSTILITNIDFDSWGQLPR
jgi:IstB-like ATP binding protein